MKRHSLILLYYIPFINTREAGDINVAIFEVLKTERKREKRRCASMFAWKSEPWSTSAAAKCAA